MLAQYLDNKILDSVFGNAGGASNYNLANIYVAVHLATVLSAGAAAAQNQISVANHIPAGNTVVIDPLGTPETFTVSSITGSGPYTLTLSGNLANARLAGVYVKFDPNLSTGADVLEPSGNAYARVTVVNNTTNFPAAASGSKSNGTQVQFAIATPAGWGLVTHAVFYDALTVGNFLGAGALSTAQLVQGNGRLTFAAGALSISQS